MKNSKQTTADASWRPCTGLAATLLAMSLIVLPCTPSLAKPLDADSCARLQSQRDALEASGVRSAIAEQPPARAAKPLDDRAKQIFALIQLDGQLRFRCNQQLPIASLKPELLVDVPDVIDGEPAPKAVPVKRPAPKRKKVAPVVADPAAPPAATGTPPPERQKTAGAKVDKAATPPAATTEQASPKPKPKPRPKSDDAYRAPVKSDTPAQPQ